MTSQPNKYLNYTQQVFLTRGYINVLMRSWLAFVNVKEHFFIFRSKVPNNYI